jgi:phage terminase large subunit-like protein
VAAKRAKALGRADAVIKFISELKIPSGYGAGQSFKLRDWQQRFFRDVYDPKRPDGRRLVRRAALSVGRKNGKGLALDTPIPTPCGWRTMADLQPGDYVFGSDGAATRVTAVSSVNTNLRCWRLTFSDGSELVADEDHQWLTSHSFRPWATPRRNGSGNGGRWLTAVVTTPQIAASVRRPRSDDGKEGNHKIKSAPAVQFAGSDLPLSPYVLGAWLGDGRSTGASLTCGDQDISELLRQLAAEGVQFTTTINAARATTVYLSAGRGGAKASKVQYKLRSLGVLNRKHIPGQYLEASEADRWALLQGLMDTDGTASSSSRTHQCELTLCNEQLAHDAWRLLRSLGIKARVRESAAVLEGREVGRRYRINFNASQDIPVFRMPRKQACLPAAAASSRRRTLTVESCEAVETVPTKCISVEAPDKLYLAGHGCVPTHNSATIAALALAHLVGPEAIKNGEIYSAANEREQAAIIFKVAAQMVRADPELSSWVRVVDSTKTMVCMHNGSVYRAISAEAGSKHGLNPSVVIYDELAQAKSRALYDVLDTAMGAREEPLFIVISTQSNDPQHILSQLIDDGLGKDDPTTVTHLYAVPDDADIWDEATWKLANPALGDFRSIDELRAFAERAQRMPSFEAPFRNLYLNQRIDAQSPLISRAEWEGCQAQGPLLEPGERVYLGLDLSSTTDLTALVAVSAENGDRLAAWFWKPGDLLREHENRDHKPYVQWAKEGWIEAPPGRAVDYGFVARRIGEIAQEFEVVALAYDRWRIEQLLQKLSEAGIEAYVEGKDVAGGGLRLVPWGQGFKDMAPAIDALEISVMEHHLKQPGNPVLTDNFASAAAITDPAGNRKLNKSATRFRIDGAVATAMAVGCKVREPVESEPEYQLMFA